MNKLKFISFAFALLLGASFTSCSDDDDDDTTPEPTILHHTDVEFPVTANSVCFYSTSLNKVFTSEEITSANVGQIDIVFKNFGNYLFFFESPTEEIAIDGARETVYRTYVTDDFMTDEIFNAIAESSDLANYNFAANDEAFPASLTPIYVIFRNASAKTGIINVKSISNGKAIIDIKVQK